MIRTIWESIKNIRRDVLLTTLAVALVMIISFCILAPMDVSAPEVTITIPSGTGLYKIAQILKDDKLIRSKNIFILLIVASGKKNELMAGDYRLSRSMSTLQIAEKFARGKVESNDVEILIKEGYNVWEIDQELTDKKLITVGEFAKIAYQKEGRLFPETYLIDPQATPSDILNKLSDHFELSADGVSDKILITASILEKEVKTETDMRLVAGIIQKRLDKKMPLQLDATVAYGACLRRFLINGKDCDVTQIGIANEIKIDSSYNTYTQAELPRGPISNPGMTAIRSAKNPKSSDYLYYLSAKDSTTIFSKTLAEHERNRKKYLGY